MKKQPAIYILTNKKNGTLYVGVTSNLLKRIYEHKNKIITGFRSKYGCNKLVYYEIHNNMETAITKEKQIKSLLRNKKINLINSSNPYWQELSQEIL